MNRNYTLFPVQTHLELFMQMSESVYYSSADIEKCNKAYTLALNCVYDIARGSGKPFICHLVGTASILVAQKAEIDVVVAGLMHALFQNRVNFPGTKTIEERYNWVGNHFNQHIAQLVLDYTEFENVPLRDMHLMEKEKKNFQQVLIMRLADELEDLTYFSLFMHGNEDDNEEVKGSYLWRRKHKSEHIQSMLSLLQAHCLVAFTEAFDFWIHAEPDGSWSQALKSGKYSSYSL
jgi:hypothetical protein